MFLFGNISAPPTILVCAKAVALKASARAAPVRAVLLKKFMSYSVLVDVPLPAGGDMN
jgi:hypothetical protein